MPADDRRAGPARSRAAAPRPAAVDRRRLPPAGEAAAVRFPPIARRTLPGGAELRTVAHHDPDLVSLCLLVPSGAAADPPGGEGLAAFTADLLDDGTRTRSGIALHEALGDIGGALHTDVSADATVLAITALARHAGAAVRLLVELAAAPRFDPADVERVRALRTSRIAQLRHVAGATANRAFLRAIYGAHPYGHPAIGTGPALARIGVDEIRAFHAAAYVPARWTLVAAGRPAALRAVSDAAADAVPAASTSGVGASAAGGAAAPSDPAPAPPGARVTFVPRPGAVQSEIRVGQLGVARRLDAYPAVVVMSLVLGGQFVSRLNHNLRETRGYTYGVQAAFDARRGRGPFAVQTAVDAAVTADAVRETLREIREIRGARPVTDAELAIARPAVTRGLPRRLETAGQIARAVLHLALHGLPDDEHATLASRVAHVDPAAATAAAARHLDPEALRVVVVGPPAVRTALAGLGLGDPADASTDGDGRIN